MKWLNYHHLLYFWQVARTGSIAQASTILNLTPQTISVQIKSLEENLGKKLFFRRGRNLVLTQEGDEALKYADQIFDLGFEMLEKLGRPERGPSLRLNVGTADVLSKHIVQRLLEPVFHIEEAIRMIVHEDKTDRLLAEVALQNFDVVLTDAPMPEQARVRAYSHLLGKCDVVLVAARDLAKELRKGFPGSLSGAPFLLPTQDTMLRHSLEHWFHTLEIHPFILGEFADGALLKVFGENGHGVFAIPSVIEKQVCKVHKVRRVGRIENIEMRYYAISVERKITHPAVTAITTSAREELFGGEAR